MAKESVSSDTEIVPSPDPESAVVSVTDKLLLVAVKGEKDDATIGDGDILALVARVFRASINVKCRLYVPEVRLSNVC